MARLQCSERIDDFSGKLRAGAARAHNPLQAGATPAPATGAEPRMVRESHLKLAQMHEALGQHEEAAAHFRQCALASIL